ncbi:MAG: Gfo/Idh/MocA family oxidoreductase [Chloroflexaceae bacterium]|jgi:predicted dehydrogenase|nr:Gfo/Idh/MocA family oxidoreductase [Chloroflexaceae bacterium]
MNPLNLAIIGCGNIAGPYARDIATYPHLRLIGCADVEPARAAAFAAEHGCVAYPSVAALLADSAVDLVVNLTIHHAHYDISMACFDAGKHVYSEKPLATSYKEARALADRAEREGLRLGCSPCIFLGEAQQTMWYHLRSGKLDPVRVAYAEVNWGRIESWHPNPAPFYAVGALWDVGVYPLTSLTAMLGPARRVRAHGTLLYPDRVTKDGTPFSITTPDFVVALIELANGTLVRLTTNFYVKTTQQHSGIELHGDGGSLHLDSWMTFNSGVSYGEFGDPLAPLPLLREAPPNVAWGRGLADMAEAIRENRPHRATGAQAAHIVEILEATSTAARTGQPVEIESSFPPPAPMNWA